MKYFVNDGCMLESGEKGHFGTGEKGHFRTDRKGQYINIALITSD